MAQQKCIKACKRAGSRLSSRVPHTALRHRLKSQLHSKYTDQAFLRAICTARDEFLVCYVSHANATSSTVRLQAKRGSRSIGSSLPIREQDHTSIVHEEEVDAISYGNETRILGGTDEAFQRPWHRDKRRWVRWPAQAWYYTEYRLIHRGRNAQYWPKSNWWSRLMRTTWLMFQRHGGSTNSFMGPLVQNYLNLLLVFVPISFITHSFSVAPGATFALSFLAIVPLSGLVHQACEHLSAHLSLLPGRLLVNFSDNLVELVVSDQPFSSLTAAV